MHKQNETQIQVITKSEYFEFSLNIDESRISSTDLISYLSNTQILCQAINSTLNAKFSIGYDNIEIDVLAIEKGSFKIPLCIKKITRNPLFASITGTIIGGVVVNLLTNQNTSYSIQTPIESIEVTNADFLESTNTKHAIGRIAQLAIETDGLKDVSMKYEKENGDYEKVTIAKETLSQIAYENNNIESEQMTNLQEQVRLEIVSPVFLDKPSTWKVLYNNTAISAQMADVDFLDTMDVQKIAFAKGDAIIADLECIVTNTANGIKQKYYIRKVHSYPKYTKIIRNKNNQQQSELFQ